MKLEAPVSSLQPRAFSLEPRASSLWLFVALACLCAMLFAGCALYRNDRAWVPKEQYQYAREMFIQTGSLDLVQQRLTDMKWRRAKVNEIVYRLGKEFEVLPEELPAQPPAEIPAKQAGG